MPQLTFELGNPRFVFQSDEDGDNNELLLDGQLRTDGTFTIILENGSRHDGSTLECYITVSERKAPTALEDSLIAPTSAKDDADAGIRAQRGLLTYSPAWLQGETGQTHKPHLGIQLALPPLAFNALHNANSQHHSIFLHFSNRAYGEALAYGYDPEGREVEWNVVESNAIYAEEVSLVLVPKPPPIAPIVQHDSPAPTIQPSTPGSISLDLSVGRPDSISVGLKKLFWLVAAVATVFFVRSLFF